ncbi:MAG TPA: sigma-70 family RNA polymerase sigma factor [Caulobacteraceae bacterium]|nr:sigma-70 family RNA polymerase sigma factor [Caulobacteraceae bacterium]
MSAEPVSYGAGQELLDRWSRRYRPALLSFFQRRMPQGADREDLVQEVFLRLARREDLAGIENIDGYLFHAAANVLTDWRRKQVTHRAAAHGELSDTIEDVGFSAERVLMGKETVRSLVAALGALPERTRAVFMLYHFQGLSHADIGRRLGIAIRTVEDHMARANAHLVRVMGKQP